MASDEEFPPLLSPGLQRISLEDLKKITVDGFSLSSKRKELWANFIELIEKISILKLPCEIWVDGSFLTKKIEPNDIDFVVDFPIGVTDNPTSEQVVMLDDLGARAFYRTKKLHSFVMFTAPAGHNYYPISRTSHQQWEKDFGFSYIKKEPKGIALIEVRV